MSSKHFWAGLNFPLIATGLDKKSGKVLQEGLGAGNEVSGTQKTLVQIVKTQIVNS